MGVNDADGRWAHRLRQRATLRNILILGAVVRLLLVPLWFGQDFIVWRVVAQELLHGRDFYSNKPAALPGGPFAYLPLFAYIEVPFRLIANLTHTSFTFWGKLPILMGDALVVWAIVKWCAKMGVAQAKVAIAVAMWWLNPLVLFNGALYGRFDSLVLGVLMSALLIGPPRVGERWYQARSTFLFAASIALKTFPAFLLPWFWRNAKQRNRLFAGIIGMCAVWSLPFSLHDPSAFIHATVLYDTGKVPSNLSWQVSFVHIMSPDTTRAIGTFILIGFFITLFMLTKLDLVEYCAAAFCAFVVFGKIVNEQYLVWAIPFLVLLVASGRGKYHGWMLGAFTVVGTFVNPLFHPIGRQGKLPTLWINLALAAGTSAYLAWQWNTHHARTFGAALLDDSFLDERERELLYAPAPADIVPQSPHKQ